MSASQESQPQTVLDVAIIGSGFAGLSLAWYLRQAGIDSFAILEKAGELGGVWRENTYPGAACDIPSHLYSLSFEPHYAWDHRYGKQAEIIAYMHQVARKYDLLRHIRFGWEAQRAEFDAARGLWQVHGSDGRRVQARVLVGAVGQLHRPALPPIPGREDFAGTAFHSAQWDHGYDFRGKTVAVIGTGASAVQFVPQIAEQVRQLYVFQRSPAWCIPKFDRRFSAFEKMLLRRLPQLYDLDRARIFWFVEGVASAMLSKSLRARTALALFKAWSRAQLYLQVRDPALRRKLTPDAPPGCKRTLLSNEWLPALARANVELVTAAVSDIEPTGVRTADGRLRAVDAIVYGTGFAATEFLAPLELVGLEGRSLRQLWRRNPEAYLGVAVHGFPNLQVMYGPNTNLGAGSILYMLEAQSRYIVQFVQLLQRERLAYLDVRAEVQQAYNDELRARTASTSYESGCHSWYVNADGRNTNNWVGYMHEYGRRLAQLQAQDYRQVRLPQRQAA